MRLNRSAIFFFFNDTATTEIYTLSLHDALPISASGIVFPYYLQFSAFEAHVPQEQEQKKHLNRSEEHTSELQSLAYLVCRLLLEKKKTTTQKPLPVPPLTPWVPSSHFYAADSTI